MPQTICVRLALSCCAVASLLLSACHHTGQINEGGEPKTLATSLGEGQCREVPEYATPLILDWRSDQRADLETAMSEGVVAVKYDCKTIEVVRDCRAEGGYGFMGVQRKQDALQLASADEIRANLPTFGASLSASMRRGSALDLAFVTVGKKRTLVQSLRRSQLPEACAAATHFVRGAYVGAFSMREGKAGKISAAAEILGYGAAGSSESSSERTSRDGRPDGCQTPGPGQIEPPQDCSSLLRLELVAIGAETKAAELEVSGCPRGMVLKDDKCVTSSGAGAHQCDPANPSECKAQCEAGDQVSCAYYGYAVHYAYYGENKDVTAARVMYEKSCAAGVQFGCAGLGIMYSRGEGGVSLDKAKANQLARTACDAGVPRGCNNLGVSYDVGAGVTKDLTRAVELFRRACAGGLPYACVNLGKKLKFGHGVPKDLARARELFEQSCKADQGDSCSELGWLYWWGQEVPQDRAQAASLFRKACEGGRTSRSDSACLQLGWAYVLGEGVTKDAAEGVRRMQQACDDRFGPACMALADLHLYGKYTEKNELKGNGILDAACGNGVGDACSSLGFSYEKGRGVAVNQLRAQDYYKRACDLRSGVGCFNRAVTARGLPSAEVERLEELSCTLGYAGGCFVYGKRLSLKGQQKEAQELIEGACEQRDRAACEWLATRSGKAEQRAEFSATACELGSGAGCVWAGQAYQYGRGVATSHLKAADFFDRGCKESYTPACIELARLYETSPDLPKDADRSLALRKQACILEAPKTIFWNCKPEWADELCADLEVCTQYAYKIAKGTQAQVADPKRAVSMWKKGCDAKHLNGCWGLAEAYQFGWGVTKSKSSARKYFKLACEYGADPAKCKEKLSQK